MVFLVMLTGIIINNKKNNNHFSLQQVTNCSEIDGFIHSFLALNDVVYIF